MKKLLALIVVVVAILGAVLDPFPAPPKRDIQNTLTEASKVELVGLQPEIIREESPTLFGMRKVTRRRTLSEAERAQVLSALQSDLRYRVWTVGRCFNPRHGLALTTPAGEYRLLLCYECSQMEMVSPEGRRGALVPLAGSSAGVVNSLLNQKP
ncbi:MAG: hypothetical protein KF760_30200 [Candidatus Eremiobacteraeota bacterium]|nr:hypothetical protein [Candidatus Eremiobacteraeota bacterium]MCW5871694.1 hypothetical protein [Candidatus Eremiobacteraeota bacterium]